MINYLKFKKVILTLFIGFLAFIMTGCQSNPYQKNDGLTIEQRWQKHKSTLETLTHYQVRGSFSYFSGKRKNHARFFWQQTDAQHYSLQLTAPIGGKLATINVTPQSATFIDNKGNQYTESDTHTLLSRLTAIDIPLTQLRYVLIGLVDVKYSTNNTTMFNENGTLKSALIEYYDQQWDVIFKDYRYKSKRMLPYKIELKQLDTLLNLTLTQWKF